MRQLLLKICGFMACAILGTAAVAASSPSVAEIEASALKRLDNDESYLGRLSGLRNLPANKAATRKFLNDIFKDDAFVIATRRWVDSLSPRPGDDELLSLWSKHFQETALGGMALISDEDINFIANSTVFREPMLDADACVRLASNKMSQEEAMKLLNPSEEELGRYFDIFKRAYLGAMANVVPRRMPSADEVAAARVWLLTQMSEEDRQLMVSSMSEARSSADLSAQCKAMRVFALALSAAPGESGKLLRREFIVSQLRADFTASSTAPRFGAQVQGAHSGRFEPGVAVLEYPRQAAREGIEGEMTLRIWVDERGDAARIKVLQHKFNKSHATLSNGEKLSVEEMFDPIVVAYYRSGKFMQQYKDGKPTSYVVEVPMVWSLDRPDGR